MYHLLTGKSPYEPPYQFVPARQLEPRLSHGVEYILGKCVQPEPADRYQNVELLLDDLNHIYRFDKAYHRYRAVKRARVLVIAGLLCVSVGLMAGGRALMAREKEQRYSDLLMEASQLYTSAPDEALDTLELAQSLYPDREEGYRQYAYALYLNGDYQACVDYGESCPFPRDGQILLTVASAYFEQGEYEQAARDFYDGAQSFEMNADHLRDYAVCLGRTGDIDGAEEVLEELTGLGASPEVTAYVQGEVAYAKGEYAQAEADFQSALDQARDDALIRRYGYCGRDAILAQLEQPDLRDNMSAAAHLIHGSSDGRFQIRYAVKNLSRAEIEGVRYLWADYDQAAARYDPAKLKAGFQRLPDGEEIFFIPNPTLGLWICRSKFAA